MGIYPENDYRNYLEHSAKGKTWSNHKYVAIKNGRYIYPSTTSSKSSRPRGRKVDYLTETVTNTYTDDNGRNYDVDEEQVVEAKVYKKGKGLRASGKAPSGYVAGKTITDSQSDSRFAALKKSKKSKSKKKKASDVLYKSLDSMYGSKFKRR
jgi:hypothetical protein